MDFNNAYSADKPITSSEQDQLQRAQFANQIAYSIVKRRNTEGLVIGLYGEWGEGKSSVMNLVEQVIRVEKEQNNALKIVLAKFNPWRYTHEEALLRRFFSMLALSVKGYDENEELKKGILQVRDIYYGSNVQFEDDERNEEELQRIISTILENKQIKIVIFIDDIDRLDKDEIYTLFRLVKLNANFSNTTYLLAFDKNVVADALGERFGSSGKQAGLDFIEKIVQVPLILPKLSKNLILEYCFENIRFFLENEKIELSKENWDYLKSNFKRGIIRRIKTPREVVKYINILNLSVPLMKGEVNILQLMLLEAIKMFYPNVYKFITTYYSPVKLRSAFSEDVGNKENFNKGNFGEVISEFVIEEQDEIKALLRDLFDTHENSFKWKGLGEDYFFERYLSFSTPKSQISYKSLATLVRSCLDMSTNDVIDELHKLISIDKYTIKNEILWIDEDYYLANKIKLFAAFIRCQYDRLPPYKGNQIFHHRQSHDFFKMLERIRHPYYCKCDDELVNILTYKPRKYRLEMCKVDESLSQSIQRRMTLNEKFLYFTTVYIADNTAKKGHKSKIPLDKELKEIFDQYTDEEKKQIQELRKEVFEDDIYDFIKNFDKRLLVFTEFTNGRKILTEEQYHLIFRLLKADFRAYKTNFKLFLKKKQENDWIKESEWHRKTHITTPFAEIWSVCQRKEFLNHIKLQIENDEYFIDKLINGLTKLGENWPNNKFTEDKFLWLSKFYDIDMLFQAAINLVENKVMQRDVIEKVNNDSFYAKYKITEKENIINNLIEDYEKNARCFIDFYNNFTINKIEIRNL